MKRLAALLPKGTLLVGLGVGTLGAAAYAQLAVAGHTLPAQEMAALAVMWSIVAAVAPGLFLPLEQEVTRLVASRRAVGDPIGPVLSKGLIAVCLACCVLLVGAWATQDWVASLFFHGNRTMVWLTFAAIGVTAAAHATRGALAGLGRFGWYGSQLAIDGSIRLVGTAVVASSAMSGNVSAYAMLIALAPLVSVLCTLPPIVRSNTAGVALPWADLSGKLGQLTASAFLNQLMINVAVINAQLLAGPDDGPELATALLAAMILVRIPVFLFGAMHGALLAGATTAVAESDREGLRRLIRRALIAVTAMAGAAAVVLVPLGSFLAARLFNAPSVLTWLDFLLLCLGVVAYLWAFVFGQTSVALEQHGRQALCWMAGTVVLFAVCLLPLQVSLRVELGLVLGAFTTAALLGMGLRRSIQSAPTLTVLVPEAAAR
ncbi:hypothetical protein Rhe02_76950 [Rhizocola hellebori]|uniref:Uncharacterized protein n=1 Tax=Rhizocola hellebori TaxID=1392758 RepID=A0A8J3VL14_9ACTN|nr:polysaccharide biosynthesis protein [Rhizocola hellebori]GIH09628.1 hypothetical protein Rhe02_76950 [Rhizocola hellebori]